MADLLQRGRGYAARAPDHRYEPDPPRAGDAVIVQVPRCNTRTPPRTGQGPAGPVEGPRGHSLFRITGPGRRRQLMTCRAADRQQRSRPGPAGGQHGGRPGSHPGGRHRRWPESYCGSCCRAATTNSHRDQPRSPDHRPALRSRADPAPHHLAVLVRPRPGTARNHKPDHISPEHHQPGQQHPALVPASGWRSGSDQSSRAPRTSSSSSSSDMPTASSGRS